ncbi:MAG: hypothetical protein OIF51_16605 [Cellvibrionaceae bacterium]|nr:hypothetical protein [Cellvibrionaceae bacterium]
MKKLLAAGLCFALVACGDINSEKLPTSSSTGAEVNEFEDRIAKELTKKDYGTLNAYMSRVKDHDQGITVEEALAAQRQYLAEQEQARLAKRKAALDEFVANAEPVKAKLQEYIEHFATINSKEDLKAYIAQNVTVEHSFLRNDSKGPRSAAVIYQVNIRNNTPFDGMNVFFSLHKKDGRTENFSHFFSMAEMTNAGENQYKDERGMVSFYTSGDISKIPKQDVRLEGVQLVAKTLNNITVTQQSLDIFKKDLPKRIAKLDEAAEQFRAEKINAKKLNEQWETYGYTSWYTGRPDTFMNRTLQMSQGVSPKYLDQHKPGVRAHL